MPPSHATAKTTLRIGHSPDPDDAFMWYPLANFPNGTGPGGKTYTPRIDTRGYEFVHVLEDIQSLNERTESSDPARELEITALSVHQYPFVAHKYALTSCGSSMGDGYGPMVVSRGKLSLSDLPVKTIAVPGTRTTAFLTLTLLLGKDQFKYEVVPFDQIIPAVVAGRYEAGLIIHEGQLTYAGAGLHKVIDLGEWWKNEHNLPLPLGGNAIRRDVFRGPGGLPAMREVTGVLLDSIRYALEHRDEAVAYALAYARDMGKDLADRFVGMYVNKWTLDYGPTGRAAVNKLLGEANKAGLTPAVGEVDFVEPG